MQQRHSHPTSLSVAVARAEAELTVAADENPVGAADHRSNRQQTHVALLLPPIISTRWQKLTSALLGRRRRSHDAYGDVAVMAPAAPLRHMPVSWSDGLLNRSAHGDRGWPALCDPRFILEDRCELAVHDGAADHAT
jgi:hypothetical protein